MKIYGCFATKKKYSRLPSLLKCWRCPGICTSALGICLGMLFHRQLLAGDDVALLHTRHIDCIPYRTYSCVKNLRARSLLSFWLYGLCLIYLQFPSGLEISGMAQTTVSTGVRLACRSEGFISHTSHTNTCSRITSTGCVQGFSGVRAHC